MVGGVLASLWSPSDAVADNGLTWHGITLYGTVDVGIAHQSHGAPLSPTMYTGLAYLISKNSNRPITSVAPNGLSQSKIGLRGDEPIGGGFHVVFNVETGFNPESLRLSDALASLVHNNGVPQDQQSTGADGSRAGQAFSGPAFVGLSSDQWGTFTFGRHNTLLTDAVIKYDPLRTSYAFSVLGASGTTAGGGNTQDVRLDGSFKYTFVRDWFHAGVMFQPGFTSGSPGDAEEGDAGVDLGRLSVDGVYAAKKDAINAASLSADQLSMPGIPQNSLAATVSDTSTGVILASYRFCEALVVSGGYVRITYKNPSSPLSPGFAGLGGYLVSFVNDTAYNNPRVLQVSWLGADYKVTDRADLIGAWYHYNQNSYAGNGCADQSSSGCSGALNAYSAVLDYRLTKQFDTYIGVMYSRVSGGLASGYLFTSAYSPMAGVRLRF